MSLLRREVSGETAESILRDRLGRRTGSHHVTTSTAMRHSAVWACVRLRADLVSTMPVDVFKPIVTGSPVTIEVAKPPVLIEPSSHGDGHPVDIVEWMYSTQMDLDRHGNAIGPITARDGAGLPARIDLVPAEDVRVVVKGGYVVEYQIGRTTYTPREVWHERQYTVPGLHVGLSPIAYAAWSISGYLSAQEFALDWFQGGAQPSSTLKNEARELKPLEAEKTKDRFMASVRTGEPFVHGKDWTYTAVGSKAAESAFLEEMKYGVADVCRFFGVPGDMIDAPPAGSSVTYANITQRNLQLLIMNLGPAVTRREKALSRLVPNPRFVKLNSDAMLRMDPLQRSQVLLAQVAGKIRTPSEARALDNLPPFTQAQLAELKALQILDDRSPAKTAPGGTS